MNYKNVKLSIVISFAIGITTLQAQTMYVKQLSGTQATYLLSEVRKMDFNSGKIIISDMNGSSDILTLNNLQSLSFQNTTTLPAALEKQGGRILLYPNPVIDVLNIQLTPNDNQEGIIEILSIDGKTLFSQVLNSTYTKYELDLTSLYKGLYLCRINTGKTIETSMILKQ